MNIYYTAKDIEELAANGVQQLEVGPGVTLTDFAKESAQQLGVELVDSRKQQVTPAPRPSSPGRTATSQPAAGDKYNKPSGCMHGSGPLPAVNSQATSPSGKAAESADPNTVNRLIDLMGKVIKRGG